MPGRQDNVLRTYHVLVLRTPTGFVWQIRYGRNTSVVQQSTRTYQTFSDAETAGADVLAAVVKTAVLLGNSVVSNQPI